MGADLQSYLEALGRKFKLDPRTEKRVVRELRDHLEEKVQELNGEGFSSDQAVQRAIGELGPPETLARDIHAVHSRSSWWEAFLATLPHLLLAALFALHLWGHAVWAALLLAAIALVTLRAWRSGKPRWAYPWLGYTVAAPALSWLLTLVSLAYGGWMYFTTGALPYSLPIFILLLAYIPFALWVVATVVLKLVRQDWLLVGLSALPLPFLTSWILFLNWQGGLWALSPGFAETDGSRALVFLALALTTAVFYKVGHRLVKIGLLTASTVLLVVFATLSPPMSFSLLAAILIAIASAAFLLSPALLESRLERKEGWYRPLNTYREVVTDWFVNTE
jgi:hypothetical protein